MAIDQYPTPDIWKQCLPTTREEVTRIITDMSQNGVIRGRVFYDSPRYRLTITHLFKDATAFENSWEQWITDGTTIQLQWAVDGVWYEGLPAGPPIMEYVNQFNIRVSFTLLCKQLATAPVI
jgi:hypothetical protein